MNVGCAAGLVEGMGWCCGPGIWPGYAGIPWCPASIPDRRCCPIMSWNKEDKDVSLDGNELTKIGDAKSMKD